MIKREEEEVERLRQLPLEEFKREWDDLLKRIRAMGKPTLLERIKDWLGIKNYDYVLLNDVHDFPFPKRRKEN